MSDTEIHYDHNVAVLNEKRLILDHLLTKSPPCGPRAAPNPAFEIHDDPPPPPRHLTSIISLMRTNPGSFPFEYILLVFEGLGDSAIQQVSAHNRLALLDALKPNADFAVGSHLSVFFICYRIHAVDGDVGASGELAALKRPPARCVADPRGAAHARYGLGSAEASSARPGVYVMKLDMYVGFRAMGQVPDRQVRGLNLLKVWLNA